MTTVASVQRKGMLVLAIGITAVACAPKQVVSQPAAPVAATVLRLESVSPTDGEPVEKGSVLKADLTYAIADFERGAFRVIAQFETNNPSLTTDGAYSGSYPTLTSATGRCQVRFPVRAVWGTPEVKRPFTVWFYLTKRTEPRVSTIVAKAGPVHFRHE